MTLNAWFHQPLEARSAEIMAWIEAFQPDLVCLQEIENRASGDETMAHRMASSLPWACHVGFASFRGGSGVDIGTAVLSRWPIEEQTAIELPCTDPNNKSALHARTGGLDVFSVHLSSAPDGALVREAQALRLDEFVAERRSPEPRLPSIVGGDFNATPGSSAIRFLRGEQSLAGRSTFFQDAWAVAGDGGPGHTWSRSNPNLPPAYLYEARCDYIFVAVPPVPLGWSTGNPDVQPAGQVIDASIVCHFPRTGVFASDHFGVAADICCPQLS